MNNIINTLSLGTCNFIGDQKGEYRAIVKCRAGFMTVDDAGHDNKIANEYGPAFFLQSYKKDALQTIQFKANGSNNWLNVFARKGKKIVVIDEAILKGLTVGTINQLYSETNLYSQKQYAHVNAKSWACKAFVMNAA